MPKITQKKKEILVVKKFRGTFKGITVTNPDKDEHVGSILELKMKDKSS